MKALSRLCSLGRKSCLCRISSSVQQTRINCTSKHPLALPLQLNLCLEVSADVAVLVFGCLGGLWTGIESVSC